MSATASTDRDSVSKRKRGGEIEDEEDQAQPAAFRTLPPADTGPALALQETQLRHTLMCVRSSCRPESRIAQENGNWLEVGRSTNML